MKSRFLIIIGIVLFLIGIFMLYSEIFGVFDIVYTVETQVSFIFLLIVPGMVIIGIGVVLEFTKRKYDIR